MRSKKGQIGVSNVVWNVRDDGTAGSTAQLAYGLRGIAPFAIVHALPEFIWEMSVTSASIQLDRRRTPWS